MYVLSPAPPAELPPLPPALLLTGNSWIGDAGARGRAGSCPAVHRSGGHRSAPRQAPAVSEAPLTWSSPGRSSSCCRCPPQCHRAGGAWLQDVLGWEPRRGHKVPSGDAAQPLWHFLEGAVTRRRGSATHQVSVWFTAPSRGEAELPLSTERGPAAAPHPYQHLRPARRPLQLHAPPPPPPPPPSPARLRGQGQPPAIREPKHTRHVPAARHVE